MKSQLKLCAFESASERLKKLFKNEIILDRSERNDIWTSITNIQAVSWDWSQSLAKAHSLNVFEVSEKGMCFVLKQKIE